MYTPVCFVWFHFVESSFFLSILLQNTLVFPRSILFMCMNDNSTLKAVFFGQILNFAGESGW